MRTPHDDLSMSRDPISQYGNLESIIRGIREHRPQDLNAEQWRQTNPDGSFEQWADETRSYLANSLDYDPGPLDLSPEIMDREERDGYIQEQIMFNTTPWSRVDGYFLYPSEKSGPVPGIVMMHAFNGPMIFGKERLVNTGKDQPFLAEHRVTYYGDRYLAEEYARQGYAVVVIDAHHFGDRAPRGFNGIPDYYDPFTLTLEDFTEVDMLVKAQLYPSLRQLNWAGATWAGLNYWDDRRCVDYLVGRPEVDNERIGCTGFSGGGWRTQVLAALDQRIKTSVSVGWMTTGDYQQIYNVEDAVSTFHLLPGVWYHLDVPDLTILSAPQASMVVVGSEDHLFPPEAQVEAVRQIQQGFEWAGYANRFRFYHPSKPHCYDVDIQQKAFEWFERHL